MPAARLPEKATILVTGASQGIGQSLALEWAGRGHDVILTARSATALEAVAQEVRAMGSAAHVIPVDLSEPQGVKILIDTIAQQDLNVDVLVNNAGFGMAKAFAETAPEDVLGMMDVNMRALTALTHHYLPGMISRRTGGVLNVASIAGFAPGPYMALYFATKNFVLSLSEALHEECKPEGVVVTALCPGPVRTGFGRRAGISEDQFQSAPGMLSTDDVARAGIKAFLSGKRVIVPGILSKLSAWSIQILPHAMTLRLISSVQSRIEKV